MGFTDARKRAFALLLVLLATLCALWTVSKRWERLARWPVPLEDVSGWNPNASLAAYVRASPRWRGEFVLLALTNMGNLNFTINWLVSLHRVGIDVRLPLIVCTDMASYEYLHKEPVGLNAIFLSDQIRAEIGWPVLPQHSSSRYGTIASEQLDFQTEKYGLLVKIKFAISAFIIYHLGVPLIFSDVDVVLLRTIPTHALHNMVDLLNQAERERGISMLMQHEIEQDLCTGLYIARPAPIVRRLFQQVDHALFWNDALAANQGTFSDICKNEFKCLGRFVDLLPYDAPSQYLAGHLIFWSDVRPAYDLAIKANWTLDSSAVLLEPGSARQNIFVNSARDLVVPQIVSPAEYPLTAHANFLVGMEKLTKLIEYGLWWMNDPSAVRRAGLSGTIVSL